ncbi:ABC transporter substrate-binding protein [Prosthecomicrobium sp. N25]|uniref:ABC transporter substrate-binding protein n=1 Tax=Prosthecomicrobium sp. N25 TaxID=3129254 RepID=UPI0030785ADF
MLVVRGTALVKVFAAIVLALAVGIAPARAEADAGGTGPADAPIRLTLNDWTGQRISARIMGEVLRRGGFPVEYVEADYLGQFEQLATGEYHLAMEMWATTGKADMDRWTATGRVVSFGETGMMSREEWWYPAYMAELCPGLPDWKALARCASLFATPATAPKGRYLGAPRTWGGHDEERVKSLGLDFVVQHAETDAQLYRELGEAYDARRPIVLWVFAPHWVQTVFDGEWVSFPPYTEECYASGRYDCAKPAGPIWKVAWSGFEARWPAAARAARAFRIENDEMSRLIGRVELGGRPIEEVVDAWLATNEPRWRGWLE